MKNKYRFRTVPASDEIIELLVEKASQKMALKKLKIKQTPEQLLFTQITSTGEINQPLHKKWLNDRLKKISEKYGTTHIKPHGLRHTFVSDMLNHGVDGLIVKALVGHSDTSNMIRDVYGHASDESKVNAISLVDGSRKQYRHQSRYQDEIPL